MRLISMAPSALALAALALSACAPARTESALGPVQCPGISVVGNDPAGNDPDFTRYGFPRVAATVRFIPGQPTTISADPLTVALPGDLYTEPLDFELLTGSASDWQPCVGNDHLVLAPYAYRVKEVATGRLVSRFDKPAQVTIRDPRLDSSSTYWTTTAENPPTAEPSSNPYSIDGTTCMVENPAARRGWFLTAPKR